MRRPIRDCGSAEARSGSQEAFGLCWLSPPPINPFASRPASLKPELRPSRQRTSAIPLRGGRDVEDPDGTPGRDRVLDSLSHLHAQATTLLGSSDSSASSSPDCFFEDLDDESLLQAFEFPDSFPEGEGSGRSPSTDQAAMSRTPLSRQNGTFPTPRKAESFLFQAPSKSVVENLPPRTFFRSGVSISLCSLFPSSAVLGTLTLSFAAHPALD